VARAGLSLIGLVVLVLGETASTPGGGAMPDCDVGGGSADIWLRIRLDETIVAAALAVLEEIADVLSLATGDGATVQLLSSDGQWLVPLAVVHPSIKDELTEAMRATSSAVKFGLWRAVIEDRETVNWDIKRISPPPEASPEQRAFLEAHRATRFAAAPIVAEDQAVGAVSLVRIVTDRDFSMGDFDVLHEAATLAVRAIHFGDLTRLTPPGPPSCRPEKAADGAPSASVGTPDLDARQI
jgi:GAF domain-containing protein